MARRQKSSATDLPLFDRVASREAANHAIELVAAGACEAFRREALRAVWDVAVARESFIVDAVWEAMSVPWAVSDKRAMGAIMQEAKHRGWIAPSDCFVASAQVACHANPRRVWRSLVNRRTG